MADENQVRAKWAIVRLYHCGPLLAECALSIGREQGFDAIMRELALLAPKAVDRPQPTTRPNQPTAPGGA